MSRLGEASASSARCPGLEEVERGPVDGVCGDFFGDLDALMVDVAGARGL